MTTHAFLTNKAVWISAVCSLLIVGYDFFTRVSVPLNPESNRVLDWSYSAPSRHQPKDIPVSLTQWLKASEEKEVEAAELSEQKVPDMPGSSRIGDVNVRIRAIFNGTEQFAIAEVQAPEQQPQRKVLRQGDTIREFEVAEITSQYVRLRLVQGIKASSDAVEQPNYLYVFKPRNPIK